VPSSGLLSSLVLPERNALARLGASPARCCHAHIRLGSACDQSRWMCVRDRVCHHNDQVEVVDNELRRRSEEAEDVAGGVSLVKVE